MVIRIVKSVSRCSVDIVERDMRLSGRSECGVLAMTLLRPAGGGLRRGINPRRCWGLNGDNGDGKGGINPPHRWRTSPLYELGTGPPHERRVNIVDSRFRGNDSAPKSWG